MGPTIELVLKYWYHQGNKKKKRYSLRRLKNLEQKHPEDRDGIILWNAGEISYLDATVCPRRFKIRFSYMFIIHQLY
jgi:hypothetical protein